MAITPNSDFTAGATLTAQQQNNFPRGVMVKATSTTNYPLTATAAVATGMTVTFTAVAGRNYRITYYEPQVTTPSTLAGSCDFSIRDGATQLQKGLLQTGAAVQINGTICVVYVGTLTAGSRTINGYANANVTTGTPTATRGATLPAQLTVEDIGTA